MKSFKLNYSSIYYALVFVLLSLSTSQAQNQNANSPNSFKVKGKIENNDSPLDGATIQLEGTKIGTVTDYDGYFEFPKKLKKGDVLIISYLGMVPKRITIDNRARLNIDLNIKMELQEVVITGNASGRKPFSSKTE